MKQSFTRILLSDVTSLRIIIGICAILLSIGLIFGDSSYGAYDLMFRYMPLCGWITTFLVYGILKIIIATHNTMPKLFLWFMVLFGCDLWLFTTISFITNHNSKLGSEDFLILFLFLSELWVGASAIAHRKD